jgi:hypothetical protein
MATRDPATIASKWSNNLAAAANSGAITNGINSVTVAPGQAAARQKGVWLQNTTAAADTWAANVAAVPLASWQQDAINKGVARIPTGAAAAEPKFQTFMGKLLTTINSAKSQLPPRGTFQQNLQRANQMATALHNAKGTFS